MDIIRKQRTEYVLTTTLIAAIFLFVVLSGLFGVVYGSNDVFIKKALDKALDNPTAYNDNVPNDMKCVFVYVGAGSETVVGNMSIYSQSDAEQIIAKTIDTEEGKFRVGNRHFIVASKDYEGGRVYALIDRTSYHKQLSNTGEIGRAHV